MALTRQLYPTGRAWKLPFDGYFEGLHRGLAQSENRLYDDTLSILDSLIPDNDNFSQDDATDWERRLGIYSAPGTLFADRKLAILRKMKAPGKNPAHGHYLFIQTQLQAAGFNVYVHENIQLLYPSGTDTYNPATLNAAILSEVQQGDFQQGDFQQGGFINQVVARSIYNSDDIHFDVGYSLRSTFFIGGQVLGTYANVPAAREIEFRQLILQLKQTQLIAFLFINYI